MIDHTGVPVSDMRLSKAFYSAALTPRSRPVAATTARPACARTIIPTTTARSCSIPMGTTSKPCATHLRVGPGLTPH